MGLAVKEELEKSAVSGSRATIYLLSLSGFLKLKLSVISILYVKYFSEPNAFQNSMFHRF